MLRLPEPRSGARVCDQLCSAEDLLCARTRVFSPSPPQKRGEGRGEEALLINIPSLRLSPRSFLAGRERQNPGSLLRAEHNWSATRSKFTPTNRAGMIGRLFGIPSAAYWRAKLSEARANQEGYRWHGPRIDNLEALDVYGLPKR